MTYEEWKAEVDRLISNSPRIKKFGSVGWDTIHGYDYHADFQSGMTPKESVLEAYIEAKEEEDDRNG
jgi:hypothetical protein